jgi:hypothetical protein
MSPMEFERQAGIAQAGSTEPRAGHKTETPNKSSAQHCAELAQMLANVGFPEDIPNAVLVSDGWSRAWDRGPAGGELDG